MADKTVKGGASRLYVFRVVDTGSAYALKQLDGSTNATSAAHASLKIEKIVDTKPDITSPTAKLTLDQDKDDAEMLAFLKACAWIPTTSGGSSVTVGERVYEDSTKDFGEASASGKPLVVAISIGGLLSDNSKRKVTAVLGTVSEDSGSATQNATSTSKPTFTINGITASYNLALGGVLDTAFIAASQTLTIAQGLGFEIAFLNPPA